MTEEFSNEPLVANPDSHKQVKRADQKQKELDRRDFEDLKFILASAQGRRFIWRMLSYCKVFNEIWEASAKIHYSLGKRAVGLFLIGEMSKVDPMALAKMMNEQQKEQ